MKLPSYIYIILFVLCFAFVFPASVSAEVASLYVPANTQDGILFTAPSDGHYQISIDGGAGSQWMVEDPSFPGWMSKLYVFYNRPIEWTMGPYGYGPYTSDYILGLNEFYPTPEECVSANFGQNFEIDMNQGDYLYFVYADVAYSFSDNPGGVSLKISTVTPSPSIILETPNGGETWEQASTHWINWSYTGDPGPEVKIELLKGTTLNYVISAGTPIGTGGSGSFVWAIVYNQALGADYRIRINSTSNPEFADTSDSNFMISAGSPVGGTATKIGIFRNSTHLFYLDNNGNGVWNGAVTDRVYNFGISGDLPVTGDWNSDGKTEIGIFRPSTHLFYLDYNGNGVSNGAIIDRTYNFGITGDIPVSGDWNSDGRTEIGIFRPSTHLFYRDFNGNGAWNGAVTDQVYNFGISGDLPITGDWNSDGRTEIGVFRPATHLYYRDYNGNGVWDGAVTDRVSTFGITGDIPVSGDWNTDGITEIGVFRPSTHIFYEDFNGNGLWNGAVTDRAFNFGIAGDSPVTGKWN